MRRNWITYIARHEQAELKRYISETARQERLKSFREKDGLEK